MTTTDQPDTHRVQITCDSTGRGSVVVDEHDVSDLVGGIALNADAGEAPRLILFLTVPGLSLDAEASVEPTPAVAAALRHIGWAGPQAVREHEQRAELLRRQVADVTEDRDASTDAYAAAVARIAEVEAERDAHAAERDRMQGVVDEAKADARHLRIWLRDAIAGWSEAAEVLPNEPARVRAREAVLSMRRAAGL